MKKKSINSFLIFINFILYFITSFLIVTLPEYQFVYIVIFVISVLLSLGLSLYNRKLIIKMMNSKFGKKIASNLTSFFLLFFILGLVNYIAFKNKVVLDLGKRRLNSLSEQTVKLVKNLESETNFIVFGTKAEKQAIDAILKLYKNINTKIKVNWVDHVVRPDLVAKYGVTIAPSVVVENKNKKVIVSKLQELAFTNALIQIGREKDPNICFIKRDGLLDTGKNGYLSFINTLKNSAYKVSVIDLLQVESIPQNCILLAALGMKNDFLNKDHSKIINYYNSGGSLFVSSNPMINGDKIPQMRSFLTSQGIDLGNDIVVDMKQSVNGSNGSAPIITTFDSAKINTSLGGQVFLPLGSSLSKASEETENYISLASSSEGSWAEMNPMEVLSGKITFNDTDIPGPLDIAAAIIEEKRPRLIVLGNSTLIQNQYLNYQTNFNFVLNIFHWGAGQDLLTSVQSAVFKEKPIFIGNTSKRLIFYISIIFMPLIFFLYAIILFRRRRFA